MRKIFWTALCLLSFWTPRSCAAAAESIAEHPAVPYLTVMTARDPAVHAELGLNRKQRDEVADAVAEVDQPMWLLRDVPLEKCGEQLDALLSKFQARLDRILTAEQSARLDQIVLQARGFKAIASPAIAQRLKLSADQVERVKLALATPGQQQASPEQNEASSPRKSADSKQVLQVLSAAQQSELQALAGKSFDLGSIRQIGCLAPEVRGVDAWINSSPLTLASLRGKVVVVHFWAFGCINCVHNLPHYQSWQEKFPRSKVTIIGIHTPETAPERVVDNLRKNVVERKIQYPVAVDAAAENWKAWGNNMWPSVYVIDRQGQVRAWWYGELNWQGAHGEEYIRKKIQELLAEK